MTALSSISRLATALPHSHQMQKVASASLNQYWGYIVANRFHELKYVLSPNIDGKVSYKINGRLMREKSFRDAGKIIETWESVAKKLDNHFIPTSFESSYRSVTADSATVDVRCKIRPFAKGALEIVDFSKINNQGVIVSIESVHDLTLPSRLIDRIPLLYRIFFS